VSTYYMFLQGIIYIIMIWLTGNYSDVVVEWKIMGDKILYKYKF